MKLKNVLLVTDDIETSIAFYQELFGLQVVCNYEGNVIMTEGLCLQDRTIWEKFIERKVSYKSNDAELYFEENDLDRFQKKLDHASFEIKYINKLMTHSWGQRVIRIYDPDDHIIEIGESMEFVNAKKCKEK